MTLPVCDSQGRPRRACLQVLEDSRGHPFNRPGLPANSFPTRPREALLSPAIRGSAGDPCALVDQVGSRPYREYLKLPRTAATVIPMGEQVPDPISRPVLPAEEAAA